MMPSSQGNHILLFGRRRYTVINAGRESRSPPHIMVCTSITSLSSRKPIARYVISRGRLTGLVIPESRSGTIALVKIGSRTIFLWLLLLKGGAVKIVKHQVHIRFLFSLQMIYYGLVPVNLDTDVSISLPRECSRLVEHLSRLCYIPRPLLGTSGYRSVLDSPRTPSGAAKASCCGTWASTRPPFLLLLVLSAHIKRLSPDVYWCLGAPICSFVLSSCEST